MSLFILRNNFNTEGSTIISVLVTRQPNGRAGTKPKQFDWKIHALNPYAIAIVARKQHKQAVLTEKLLPPIPGQGLGI